MDYTTRDIPIGSYVVLACLTNPTPCLDEVLAVSSAYVFLSPACPLGSPPRRRRRSSVLALIPPGVSTEASRAALLGRINEAYRTHRTYKRADKLRYLEALRAILDGVLHSGEQA